MFRLNDNDIIFRKYFNIKVYLPRPNPHISLTGCICGHFIFSLSSFVFSFAN